MFTKQFSVVRVARVSAHRRGLRAASLFYAAANALTLQVVWNSVWINICMRAGFAHSQSENEVLRAHNNVIMRYTVGPDAETLPYAFDRYRLRVFAISNFT